jgi:membrane protease YdiL (CAAX protease family)
MKLRAYWVAAREARYSVLFALPLLLLYEGLSFGMTRSAFAGVRNGADVLLKTAFIALGGRHGVALFTLVILGFGAWLVWRDRRRHPGALERRYFLGMLGESVVYAVVFGGTAATLTALLLHPTLLTAQGAAAAARGVARLSIGGQLVVSLGAGIYEELLFRVLLVSGLTSLGLALKWRRPVAIGAAILLSALIFSAFHYVGPYGDSLTLASFTFRAVAGLLLSGLYVARGFGITAWTHALYDVGLAVLG